MSNKPFSNIILMGRAKTVPVKDTLLAIYDHLTQKNYAVFIEEETAFSISFTDKATTLNWPQIKAKCDLAVVVGGDGSLLHAACLLAPLAIPVLGINRGKLGFLTDIHPQELAAIDAVIAGQYVTEQRFLLRAEVIEDNMIKYATDAFNDCVLLSGDSAHMIEFEIFINQEFLCSQRADGAIIATPTGSTAYALSAGGPILHPALDAITLVPLCAHTLTSRPIVVGANSEITIQVADNGFADPGLSCDGQTRLPISPSAMIRIVKNNHHLTLVHPLDYSYFRTLRNKLYWGKRIID